MATNVTVYDLENYPDNSKTVVVDQKTVVPIGYEGDEQWVLSFTTTAYSDNTSRTAIEHMYVREMKCGWIKSSGLVGNIFTIGSSTKTLKITMDKSTGYYIQLMEGNNLKGDAIATDMETKIRAIPDGGAWNSTADSAYELSYRNASVEFEDGKFWIVSGSMERYYTGDDVDRSSVEVTYSGVDTCYQVLGFDLPISSKTLAGTGVKEVLVSSTYTAGAATLSVNSGSGVTVADALMITDGTNTDYFTAMSGTTDTSIAIATVGVQGYNGIAYTYTVSGTLHAKVQILREQDPDGVPSQYYDTVDGVIRHGIKSIANQLDFSS